MVDPLISTKSFAHNSQAWDAQSTSGGWKMWIPVQTAKTFGQKSRFICSLRLMKAMTEKNLAKFTRSQSCKRQRNGLVMWSIISAVLCWWGGSYPLSIIPEKGKGEGTDCEGPRSYTSQTRPTDTQAPSGIGTSYLSGKRSHACLAI